MPDMNERASRVLAHLGCPSAPLLGEGGEGMVFALDDARVVKIYHVGADAAYIQALAELQAFIARAPLPFATPLILEGGQFDGIHYALERRLAGKHLALATLAPAEQRRALAHYFAAPQALDAVDVAHLPYGRALAHPQMLTSPSWPTFLQASLQRSTTLARDDLAQDVPDAAAKLARLEALISTRLADPPKRLVHGDYFPGNVLFDDDLRVAALLDFSPHTVIGDRRMDVAGAISFLTLDPRFTPAHLAPLRALAAAAYGPDIDISLALYTLYYSFYFADTKQSDPATYAWCLSYLNDPEMWTRAQRG
jgi:aminoglycoside phosphotransferase (APT) family kinase protein